MSDMIEISESYMILLKYLSRYRYLGKCLARLCCRLVGLSRLTEQNVEWLRQSCWIMAALLNTDLTTPIIH